MEEEALTSTDALNPNSLPSICSRRRDFTARQSFRREIIHLRLEEGVDKRRFTEPRLSNDHGDELEAASVWVETTN